MEKLEKDGLHFINILNKRIILFSKIQTHKQYIDFMNTNILQLLLNS